MLAALLAAKEEVRLANFITTLLEHRPFLQKKK
jgi:hypothetical protein